MGVEWCVAVSDLLFCSVESWKVILDFCTVFRLNGQKIAECRRMDECIYLLNLSSISGESVHVE